ncbi:MAG: phenylacetate-CoA oxygenase subunit PaaJ [Bacteroidetes bacterium]|nr:phenylacetate-CoA oxygenase subunit PaaJ [Bacteroidota bacterium]
MNTDVKYSRKEILNLLSEIPDPEIPVINIHELGVLRDVIVNEKEVEIIITPTYSGCPAMKQIENDIVSKLKENGIENVKVKSIFSPAWTTDWITDEAKEKLRKFGIAPPTQRKVKCPHCNSENTEVISQFGSTACKALYRCNDCKEPFDYFKCH